MKLCSNISWSTNATTVAGSSDGIAGADSTMLSSPYDTYVFNDDSLLIVDTFNLRIQSWKANATNGTTVISSAYGSDLNQLSIGQYILNSQKKRENISILVMEIDVVNQTEIYLLDSYNSRVVKWNSFGTNGTIVAGGNGQGTDPNQLYFPYGMFIEKDSLTIWIADAGNHRIVKWTSTQQSSVVCGSLGSANDQFAMPTGIFIDENNGNTMYIADYFNYRIQQWVQGAVSGITVAGITGVSGSDLSHLASPMKVIVDEDQNMFILESANARVLRWKIGETSGEVIAGGQETGTGQNQLSYPQNIRFGHDGSVYVVDTSNNRIQKYQSTCRKLTFTEFCLFDLKIFSNNNNNNNNNYYYYYYDDDDDDDDDHNYYYNNNTDNNNKFKWHNQYWIRFSSSNFRLNCFILIVNSK